MDKEYTKQEIKGFLYRLAGVNALSENQIKKERYQKSENKMDKINNTFDYPEN